jgi:thiamine-phosphate pyrophosphorylase
VTGGDAPSESCRLYLITPPSLAGGDPDAFASELDAALGAGDVACVQLRLKEAPDEEIRRASSALMPVCRARDVAFIINDRADLAAELGADGVHIGAEDGGYADAREAVGSNAIVGVSCYDSRHLGLEAAEAGADYVAFGAFFPTQTKQPPAQADPDVLRWWHQMVTVPCVAIGGITIDNCPALVTAGADFLAVISGVWDHARGPAAAVKAYNTAIAEAPPPGA